MTHLIHEGNRVAQQLYDKSSNTPRLIRELGHKSLAYYKEIGMLKGRRSHGLYLTTRNVWRACLAPIVHGIEVEFGRMVTANLQAAHPLSPPEEASLSHLDRIFAHYGSFSGKNLAFLRASGWLSMLAAKKFLGEVVNDRQHWCAPILAAYRTIHPNFLNALPNNSFESRMHVITYLRKIAVASNVTALSILAPAAAHASLWGGSTDNPKATLLDRIDELGWTQTVNRHTLESHFPIPGLDYKPPETCPFAHNQDRITAGSIWQLPSLQDGPWEIERYCPANIPLKSPGTLRPPTSAATMRMATAVHIADQIW